MAVPTVEELFYPVLAAANDGARKTEDYRLAVIDKMALAEADIREPLSNGTVTKLANRIYWALINLERAGLLQRIDRGVYQITAKGLQALDENAHQLDKQTSKLYRDRATPELDRQATDETETRERPGTKRENETTLSPDERLAELVDQEHARLAEDLLNRILEKGPDFFEGVVIDALVAMGYGGGRKEMADALRAGSDEDIEGIIKQDPLGLDVVYVQAKRYKRSSPVGRPEVQAFAGALDGKGANKGVFVATSSFSREAKQYAQTITKRLVLVEGHALAGYMIANGVGVRSRAKHILYELDEDYFAV